MIPVNPTLICGLWLSFVPSGTAITLRINFRYTCISRAITLIAFRTRRSRGLEGVSYMQSERRVSSGRGVQSIEVGARVLAALTRSAKPMMLREVAEEAKLLPNQAHAYLASLRRVELVEQEVGTGKYLLGPAAIRLAVARIRGSAELALASREAGLLAEETGLMVAMVTWGIEAPTAVQVNEGAQSLDISIRPGSIFSIIGSAAGRIFGAYSSADVVRARIKAEFAARDAIGQLLSPTAFSAEMDDIRAKGYSSLVDNPVPGLGSIAAPVTSLDGELLLALTLLGNSEGLNVAPDQFAVRRLLEITSRLSGKVPVELEE